GPDRAPDRGVADRLAAAFVANIGAPAADIVPFALHDGDAGAAGADDEDRAVGALEGAHPACPGVRVDDERGEGMRPVVDRLPVFGLLRAGEAEAGMRPREVGLAESRRFHRTTAGLGEAD